MRLIARAPVARVNLARAERDGRWWWRGAGTFPSLTSPSTSPCLFQPLAHVLDDGKMLHPVVVVVEASERSATNRFASSNWNEIFVDIRKRFPSVFIILEWKRARESGKKEGVKNKNVYEKWREMNLGRESARSLGSSWCTCTGLYKYIIGPGLLTPCGIFFFFNRAPRWGQKEEGEHTEMLFTASIKKKGRNEKYTVPVSLSSISRQSCNYIWYIFKIYIYRERNVSFFGFFFLSFFLDQFFTLIIIQGRWKLQRRTRRKKNVSAVC